MKITALGVPAEVTAGHWLGRSEGLGDAMRNACCANLQSC
jgi:hypothetical protein